MTDNHSRGSPGRRDVLRGIGAVGSIAALGGVTAAQPGREPGPKPTELLVGTETTADTVSTQATVESALPSDANVVHRNETLGYLAVDVGDEARATADSAVAERIERTTGVAYAEENGTMHAFEPEVQQAQPDDPSFSQQYAPQLVNAPDAWETTYGSSDVTIAIADTGTDFNHPDLEAQFGSNVGENFAGSGQPTDGQGHGTHVAGIASATTDNGEGIAGMSNSHLYAVKVLGDQGGGSFADIADGIQWSADNGADIVNLSLGAQQGSQVVQSAIDYAFSNGTLPIAAAGNDGPCSNCVSYPAAYSNAVAVSALNSSENLAQFSSTGPEIDVAAPGADVYSTMPNGQYDSLSGTSMASPAAAGVAALGKAVNPSWGPGELRQALEDTAVDVGLPGNDQGNGRVDAANLVGDGEEPPPEEVTAVADASPSVADPGETVTFDGGDSSGPINAYEWDLGDGTTASGQTVSHSYDAEGEYDARLTVSGNSETDTDSVTVTVEEGGEEPPGDCSDYSEYSNSTLYMSGDRVAYQGAVWEAQVPVMTVLPSEGSHWWSHVEDC